MVDEERKIPGVFALFEFPSMTMSKRPAAAIADSPPPTKVPRTESSSVYTPTPIYELHYPPLDPALAPRPPEFGQPVPLLTFSYSPLHEQCFDNSALRYLGSVPPIGADLKHGYERWVRKPDTKGRLDGLLRALSRKREEAQRVGEDIKVGVCTWRGVMTKILTAPYEDRDSIKLNVMLAGGTLYLEEHLTDSQLDAKNDMNPRQREQTYFGYSFEAWSTRDTPPDSKHQSGRGPRVVPEWGGDVNTNEQWCVVVKTRLGPERLVLGGEVDCVRGEYDGTTRNLVELKTNMAIRPGNRGDEERFEKKTLRIWTQSFLLGIPTVNVGFRSPQGVVRSVQTFDTASFPRHVRGKRGPGAWDASIVLGWGARALELIRRALADGVAGEDAVWRAEFTPGCGLKVRKLEVEEIEVVQQDGEVERVGFLPKWYLNELRTGTPTPDRAKAESGVNDGRKDEIAPSGTPSPDKLLNEAPESAVAEQTL